jgi:hypothetical protein
VSPQGLVMFSAKFFFASPDGNDTGETGKRFRHSVPVPVSLLQTLMLVRTVNLTFPSCTRNNYDHNRQPRRQQVHSSAFIVPRRRRGFNWWALRRNQMVPRRFLRPPCRVFLDTTELRRFRKFHQAFSSVLCASTKAVYSFTHNCYQRLEFLAQYNGTTTRIDWKESNEIRVRTKLRNFNENWRSSTVAYSVFNWMGTPKATNSSFFNSEYESNLAFHGY